MTRVGVFGAGGRMGATVCHAVANDAELDLVAAVDPYHLGLDLRQVTGVNGGLQVQEGDVATEYDALDGVVADETQARMRRAMASLSPTQREVFVLRVSEGMSYRDIAEAVDTTEGAARVHYHNAMRAIKEYLND